jgi:hypothetical protein
MTVSIVRGTVENIQLVDSHPDELTGLPAWPPLAVITLLEANGRMRVAYGPSDAVFAEIRRCWPDGRWRNQAAELEIEDHLVRSIKRGKQV